MPVPDGSQSNLGPNPCAAIVCGRRTRRAYRRICRETPFNDSRPLHRSATSTLATHVTDDFSIPPAFKTAILSVRAPAVPLGGTPNHVQLQVRSFFFGSYSGRSFVQVCRANPSCARRLYASSTACHIDGGDGARRVGGAPGDRSKLPVGFVVRRLEHGGAQWTTKSKQATR